METAPSPPVLREPFPLKTADVKVMGRMAVGASDRAQQAQVRSLTERLLSYARQRPIVTLLVSPWVFAVYWGAGFAVPLWRGTFDRSTDRTRRGADHFSLRNVGAALTSGSTWRPVGRAFAAGIVLYARVLCAASIGLSDSFRLRVLPHLKALTERRRSQPSTKS